MFPYCTNEQIYYLFKNFYGNEGPTEEEIKTCKVQNVTPATVENVMKRFYKNSKKALELLINGKDIAHEKYSKNTLELQTNSKDINQDIALELQTNSIDQEIAQTNSNDIVYDKLL